MSSNSSGKKLEGFFTGKGFYIVLFLCAAVIGVSAWMMAAGNKTMAEDLSSTTSAKLDNQKVETVIIPAQREEVQPVQETTDDPLMEGAPAINDSGLADAAEELEGEVSQVWNEDEAAPVYTWPVIGELERVHSVDALKYDITMGDWRTHNGIDVLSPVGSAVSAARAGTVESIIEDDLYGTTITIDHGDGVKTVYANLDATPAVNAGDWVEGGSVIGAVGSTALCEVSQDSHLHFALTVNGAGADPMNYLPA